MRGELNHKKGTVRRKVCIDCGEEKPITEFHKFYHSGCRFNTCKTCVRKAVEKRMAERRGKK